MGRKEMDHPLVTVVKMSGVLQAFSGRGPQARRLLNLERVEKWLQRAFYTPLAPAACAIAINSPGGSPVQSELIHDMIRRLAQQTGIPVYTFAEDVAASGGYWLMCAGDKAYACETSLVGSIGVISATFGAVDAAQRLGIQRRVWTAGPAKLPMDPFLPVTPEQEGRIVDLMTDLHEAFKDRVRASRGDRLIGPEDELFSGRAWTGRQAQRLGLVDGVGTLRGVMRAHFGEKVRFLLCSEPAQPGLRDVLGLKWGQRTLEEGVGVFGRLREKIEAGIEGGTIDDVAYAASRAAVSAALDEAEHRSLWDRFKVG